MMIKHEAYKAFFQSRPDQISMAEKLDEGFEITFGATQGEKSYWLASPQQHMQERFGLSNEVLTIYSPQRTADARILTSIEQISRSPDFRHRIDKVLVLVIHDADKESTDILLSSDSERVIIGVTFSELNSPSRGSLFIRSKISERFGFIDLLGMSSPIGSDKYFFGRDSLVQELVQMTLSKNQNAGLFGLRKTGKTSVLQAVLRRLSVQNSLCEYVDCHSPGLHAARWWQALENIVERLHSKLQSDFRRQATLSLSYTQHNCGTRFSSDLKLILVQAGASITLLLDEIEFITPRLSGALGAHWDQDFVPFWQTIRAAHQELAGKVTFIVAGVNPSAVESTSFNSLPNPIFQLAIPKYLDPFDEAAVRKMLKFFGRYSGVQFHENLIKHLTAQFGGHPFLIRLAASETWQRGNNKNSPSQLTEIGITDFKASSVAIKERLRQPMKDILLSLVWWYPEEYQLLQWLADGEDEFVKEYLEENQTSLIRFARYGLLRESTNEFAIEDIKNFLVEHGELYKRELSPFSRSEIAPDYLPEIPDLNALGKLFEKRCEVETQLRRAVIIYFGIHFNWKDADIAKEMAKGLKRRNDRPDPAALFVDRKPKDVILDMYTLDLKNIIVTSWPIVSALFEGHKQRFEMNMDTINVARRHDGHTKPVTPAQMEDFMNSYGWLTRHLDKVPDLG
ncbi:hypothetical protein B1F74_10930 [Pseudomonas syringae]|nr:hypothetical protein B1F74_10930 [Pseudomonas syringae]